MKIKYKPSVVRQMGKLSKNEIIKVTRKIGVLADDSLCGKMLKGELSGLRSLRAWPYRIVYEIKGSAVIIYSVAHRQGVYK